MEFLDLRYGISFRWCCCWFSLFSARPTQVYDDGWHECATTGFTMKGQKGINLSDDDTERTSHLLNPFSRIYYTIDVFHERFSASPADSCRWLELLRSMHESRAAIENHKPHKPFHKYTGRCMPRKKYDPTNVFRDKAHATNDFIITAASYEEKFPTFWRAWKSSGGPLQDQTEIK